MCVKKSHWSKSQRVTHNYEVMCEKRVTDLLKKLKNKNAISEETYNKLRPVGSKPGTLWIS